MSDQFIGEIRTFACSFAPRGWAFCNGQLMAISQNTALFSLLGTTYGGDGKITFGLPNLQGRLVVGQGTGPGLSPYDLGQSGGDLAVTLNSTEIANHRHAFNAGTDPATTANPAGAVLMKGHYQSSAGPKGQVASFKATAPDTALSDAAIGPAGGAQPHNNLMPYVAINFCISLTGAYPPRS